MSRYNELGIDIKSAGIRVIPLSPFSLPLGFLHFFYHLDATGFDMRQGGAKSLTEPDIRFKHVVGLPVPSPQFKTFYLQTQGGFYGIC